MPCENQMLPLQHSISPFMTPSSCLLNSIFKVVCGGICLVKPSFHVEFKLQGILRNVISRCPSMIQKVMTEVGQRGLIQFSIFTIFSSILRAQLMSVHLCSSPLSVGSAQWLCVEWMNEWMNVRVYVFYTYTMQNKGNGKLEKEN